jgi:hypothetical protein
MSRIPLLKDELVNAATRMSASPVAARRKPLRASRRALLIAALLLLALVATAGAVAVLTGVVGGPPSAPYPRIGGEERSGMVRTKSPIVLGVADVPGSGRIELVGYHIRGYHGHGELVCVDLALPDGSKSGTCDAGLPGEASGLRGSSATSVPPPRKLATGVGGTDVARVAVRFDEGAGSGASTAVVMHVPADVGDRLGVGAFTYYIAVIPARARSFVAEASDARGRRLWRAQFP